MNELIIGSHVSFVNSTQLLGSVKEALSYDANTFMFYTGSTQSTQRGIINDELTYQAFELMLKNNINPNNVIVHAPYIINLANKSDLDKSNFYINFFKEELNRCNKLGMSKIVLHPGSATTCSREDAIINISNALNEVINDTKDVIILLEFMAGKGNEIGSSIEELNEIIKHINNQDRIGVCIDTCHMNDAGIDISNIDEFLNKFDSIIGLDKIKCVHLNDSLNIIGSHKDRHANIGYGTIGFDNLINVVYNDKLKNIPIILETPYVNRNTKNEYPPYKYEIENIRNRKFNNFINKL